jgi:chemotaxis protein methyltransferase CheR
MEPESYTLIKHQVKLLLNIDLERYKDQQMQRRLDSWLVRAGSPSWPVYFQRLRGDEKELGKLRDYLTINVSSFFRDPERWQTLRQDMLPDILKSRAGGLRVWSAGCSIGAESYTLAILLAEEAPQRPLYLLATDLDRGVLAKARGRGPYTADEIANITSEQRAAYFAPGGPPFFISEELGRKVTFREHDMLAESFEPGFDLIVCRNVVIYFTAEAKDQLYRKFADALRPGGVLFVGGTEIIPRPAEIGLQSMKFSFYLKK